MVCAKIVAALALTTILSSCDIISDSWYYSKAQGQELYYHPEFYRVENIPRYLYDTIKYKADYPADSWSSPRNTFIRRYGDCEDVSLLYLNILYVSTGKKGSLVLVEVPGRSVVAGGNINHALVEVDGVQIEPQTGMVGDYRISYRYTFHDIFGL